MASPEINDRGEVSLEGHLIGTLEGFRFTLARTDGDLDAKALRSAADQAVAPEIRNRAERLAGAPNEEFVLATDGRLRWKGEIVAELVEGDALLRPRVLVLADEALTGLDLDRVQDRLNLWLRHHINTVLEQVMGLEAPADLDGTARGIAYRLHEHLGIIARHEVADEVKSLDQDVRGKLRKLGVKFGAYHIYLPLSLKPAPRELALILFALKSGGVRQPGVSDLPHIVLSGRTSFEIDPEVAPKLYEVAGFKVAGKRAVRVDILERLADLIRPLIALDASRHEGELPPGAAEGNGFRVTVEMTSLLGCSGEDFASILTSLGYRARRTVKPPAEIAPPAETVEAAEAVEPDAPVPAETLTDAAAEANASPEGAVETVLAEATPTAEPAGELAEAEAPAFEAAPATPAEPEFDEIWFPGRRHDSRDDRRRQHGRAGDGQPGQRPQHRGPRHEEAGDTNGSGKPRFDNRGKKGGPRFDKPRGDRPKFAAPGREKREAAFDPDSPFAALAALKTKKPD